MISRKMDNSQREFSRILKLKQVELSITEGRKISRKELAEMIGISRETLYNFLNGSSFPSSDTVQKIAEIFGNEVYEILGVLPDDPKVQKLVYSYLKLPDDKRDLFLELIVKEARKN